MVFVDFPIHGGNASATKCGNSNNSKKNGKTTISQQLVLIITYYFTLDKDALFVQNCCIIVNGSDKNIISQDHVNFLNFPSKV